MSFPPFFLLKKKSPFVFLEERIKIVIEKTKNKLVCPANCSSEGCLPSPRGRWGCGLTPAWGSGLVRAGTPVKVEGSALSHSQGGSQNGPMATPTPKALLACKGGRTAHLLRACHQTGDTIGHQHLGSLISSTYHRPAPANQLPSSPSAPVTQT